MGERRRRGQVAERRGTRRPALKALSAHEDDPEGHDDNDDDDEGGDSDERYPVEQLLADSES
jgi:hypothetical protein